MAESIIRNQADFTGLYGDECPIEFTSNQVSTRIIRGLTATKTADKTCWVDGPLNYEITIINGTDTDVTNVVMQDYLDPNLVKLDEMYGVFVNGIETTSFVYSSGMLAVTIPLIEAGKQATISFRVLQA